MLEKKPSTASSNLSVSKISGGTDPSDEDDHGAFTYDSTQTSGWKSVFLLQFQPQFEVVIMIGIYISYVCSLIDITFAYSTHAHNIPRKYTASGLNFIYSFDVIYVVDILSMISYKNTEWVEMKHRYDERSVFLILLDVLSIIPLDAVYFSLTKASMRVIYFLRLRYIFRIIRFFKRISELKHTVGYDHIITELLDFLINCSLILITISCLLYYLDCDSKCAYRDQQKITESFYIITQKITSRGFPLPSPRTLAIYVLCVTTNFFSYVYVNGFAVGFFLIALLQSRRRQHLFQNMKKVVLSRMHTSGIRDSLLYQAIDTFFNLYWRNKKGFRFNAKNLQMLPEIMAKEISLDICWDLMKHSHLFRNRDTHFLRHVAPLFIQNFLIPGETIYKRNRLKNAMFYVVSGVIQILSEEDGETPILSFSGGTCIGESALFIDYPSTCNVVCQSYCEVYILYRKDFIKVVEKYPKEFNSMRKEIKERYVEAREYQTILDFCYEDGKQKREVLILKWLKMTLHDLMSKDSTGKHKPVLQMEDRHTMQELDKLVFCCKYLDMLVITEQIELVTDSVFLQTKCPCILQPDSFIVVTWSNIITVAVFIFAFIYPYFAIFEQNVDKRYFVFSYIITFLWMLDIYIKVSTAIKTKNGIITNISAIAMNRIGQLQFFLDVFAVVPFELFTLLVLGTVDTQFFILLQAPRLLKIYKIQLFFNDQLPETGIDMTIQYLLKFITYMLFVVYYMGAIFHLLLCYRFICDDDDNIYINFIKKMAKGSVINTVKAWVNIASQLITNIAIFIPATGKHDSLYIPILIAEFGAALFYIYFLASATVMESMKNFKQLRFREQSSSVKTVLTNTNVKFTLYKQVVWHMRGQLEYNGGTDLLYSSDFYSGETHPLLVKEGRRLALLDYIKRIPLFVDVPDDLLTNLIQYCYSHILVPGEVIVYAGEVCKELHLILNGYCEVLGEGEKETKVVGPGTSISDVEMCFGIPIVRTVITQTHCKLISLTHKKFMQAHQLHPEILLELKTVVNALSHLTTQPILEDDNVTVAYKMGKKYKKSSFKHFGYRLDRDTSAGRDYHECFDRLGFFGFLRYVFPRHTIRPYGKFLRYWEMSRCIFAFLTAVLTPVAMISTCDECVWRYAFYFLDATAWADIYIKHYICYFNKDGVQVTHPLKTTINYWKHGFILDLICVMPFDILLIKAFRGNRNQIKVFLRMTRLLQVYRIFCGMHYLNKDLLFPSTLWTTMKYVPIVIVFVNFVGSLVINLRCEFNTNIEAEGVFEAGVRCQLGTWITETKGKKPLSPLRTHLYGIFVMLVLLTGPGVGGFNVQNIQEIVNMTVICCIGYLFFVYITSRVVATNLFRNSDLTSYQKNMKDLVNFLALRTIDPRVIHETIEHFEYVWLKKKGKNLHHVIRLFNFALQEDILLGIYGKALKESAVFEYATNSFFRSLLLNVRHEIIMKRGIILRVNDVNDKLYFVYKGQVEVLGPDYSRLLVLPVGSIFGNIDDCERSRQTLTMVAKGHVELLQIQTALFHQILSNYSHLKVLYRELIAINTDYLLGTLDTDILYETNMGVASGCKSFNSMSSASIRLSMKRSGITGTIKKLNARSLWENVVTVFFCYLGCIAEFYQITVHGISFGVLIMLYCFDILFWIHIIINFRVPYENEYGVLVYNRRDIALHYIKQPSGFPLHLFSVFPFEIVALFFMKSENVWLIWSFCRVNRFIKVYYVIAHFHQRNQQLNINVNFLRTLFLLVWMSLLLQALNTILILVTCTDPPDSVSPAVKCNWKNMTSSEKYDLYAYTFSVLLYFFTSTSVPDYFPNSAIIIFLINILLITIRTTMTYFISEIATTLDITLHSRLEYENDIQTLWEHMNRERISPALLDRVWLHIKLLWKTNQGLHFPKFLEEAPYYLQEAVLNSMFGYHLRRHPLFSLCHTDMIRQIAAQLRTRTFFSGDYITFINDIDECMYFIHEGAVDCLSEEEMYFERIEKTLYNGEMFGFEQGTYEGCGHEFTYRANRHTIILFLKRQTWIHLLDFFPASKELIYLKERSKKKRK